MMRLQRVGRKNDPSFRVVVVDKRTGPKSNKNIDILGSYNPKLNQVQIDAEKAKVWLSKGVQPSDTVHNILVAQKVVEGKKKNVLPKKSPIVDEEAEAQKAAKAEEEAAATAETEKAEAANGDEEATTTPEEAPVEEEVVATEAPAEEAKSEKATAAEETKEDTEAEKK